MLLKQKKITKRKKVKSFNRIFARVHTNCKYYTILATFFLCLIQKAKMFRLSMLSIKEKTSETKLFRMPRSNGNEQRKTLKIYLYK